jgi:phosphatidylglycerophosphate synthase
MDVGLYMLKMPFRKLIGFLIPWFRNTNPNWISWALLPVGALMAWVYVQAFQTGQAWWLLVGISLGFLRMIVATLDGLVAVTFNKSSALGDLINRLTPELCDLMLLPSLLWATGNTYILGLLVLTFAWATPFFGLLGAPSQCPVQSVGPVGQTDRLAALMAFSFLQFLSQTFQWKISFINVFFYWLVIGGFVTLILRLHRQLKAAKALDRHGSR